jgi:hypothetical protein
MSYRPLAGCLVACLLTLAPAVTTRAEDGGFSPRRKAELDALIARRRVEKETRAKVIAIRNAVLAQQLSQAQAYAVNLAQAFTAYQMSLERQSMMQIYRFDWAVRPTSPQAYFPGSVNTGGLVIPAYTLGPVFVNFNSAGPAMGAPQASPAHSGGSVGGEQTAHATHSETLSHHGHTR